MPYEGELSFWRPREEKIEGESKSLSTGRGEPTTQDTMADRGKLKTSLSPDRLKKWLSDTYIKWYNCTKRVCYCPSQGL